MERFISLAKNKYVITVVAFLIWMTFFDRYDFSTQLSYQEEEAKLASEKDFYTREIVTIEKSIKDVQYNQSEIQRIAREKYKMKRDNEDVYVIMEVDSPDDKDKTKD